MKPCTTVRQPLAFVTADVPEPPAVCEDCADLDHDRLAVVLHLGRGYCIRHAELYDVGALARLVLRALELKVPA